MPLSVGDIGRMIESVSRRAFGGSSGTYNVRASELARDRRLKTLSAQVVFLDDTKHSFQLEVILIELLLSTTPQHPILVTFTKNLPP